MDCNESRSLADQLWVFGRWAVRLPGRDSGSGSERGGSAGSLVCGSGHERRSATGHRSVEFGLRNLRLIAQC